MRIGIQANLHAPVIKVESGQLTLTAQMSVSLPLPVQDGDLPGRWEAAVDGAGQQLKRQLFALALEQADAELLLDLCQRGQWFSRRGAAPARPQTTQTAVRRRLGSPMTHGANCFGLVDGTDAHQ
jgi:hypothetical protein